MAIEFARHCGQFEGANSSEFDPNTPYPIIDLLPEQRSVRDMGGSMRLGVYPCHVMRDTLAAQAYGADEIMERHRHRYEFNNAYREPLGNAGLLASGISPDGTLVEIAGAKDHPFMLGVQFHQSSARVPTARILCFTSSSARPRTRCEKGPSLSCCRWMAPSGLM